MARHEQIGQRRGHEQLVGVLARPCLDGREVDFAVTDGRTLSMLVECKRGGAEPDRARRYLKERFLEADAWQLTAVGNKDFQTGEGIRVAPALTLLKTLV